MPSGNEEQGIKKLLKENKKLLKENNTILKKIHRNAVWSFWVRIVWYVLLIGIPFAFYFYVLEPYLSTLGSYYEAFKSGIGEIPGLKGLGQLLDTLSGKSY